jgi:hypothetical protein
LCAAAKGCLVNGTIYFCSLGSLKGFSQLRAGVSLGEAVSGVQQKTWACCGWRATSAKSRGKTVTEHYKKIERRLDTVNWWQQKNHRLERMFQSLTDNFILFQCKLRPHALHCSTLTDSTNCFLFHHFLLASWRYVFSSSQVEPRSLLSDCAQIVSIILSLCSRLMCSLLMVENLCYNSHF